MPIISDRQCFHQQVSLSMINNEIKMKISFHRNVPLQTNSKLIYNSREVFCDVFKIKDLISFVIISDISHKNPTVCVNLITLDHIVLLSIPHLLAYIPSPLWKLEVEEQVVVDKVVPSRHHPPGDHVPGGQGGPVIDTEFKGVSLSSSKRMTGSDVTVVNPDTSLQLHHSLHHLRISLALPDTITIPEHSVLS